jgi:hypothetical protein
VKPPPSLTFVLRVGLSECPPEWFSFEMSLDRSEELGGEDRDHVLAGHGSTSKRADGLQHSPALEERLRLTR